MKILIIHLSDIHIATDYDFLSDRAEKIIDGVKNLETGIIKVYVVITGDLAYSGTEAEYNIVAKFLDKIIDKLKEKICLSFEFIIVPGNHDCFFQKGNEDARNEIIKSIKEKEFIISGKSIIDICLKNQEAFFKNCRDLFCDSPIMNNDNLFYQYHSELNNFKITFNCINSAWISTLNEDEHYGELGFPVSHLQNSIKSDFRISLFHHPFNWFEGNNSKKIKRFLQENSDLILTGHEHDPNQTSSYDFKGKKHTEYIEGGVLNNSKDVNESSFNAVFIDIINKSHKFYQLDLIETLYNAQDISNGWILNNVNIQITANKFQLSDFSKKWLEDPGATIYYQYNDDSLTLDEIFVYPEIKETFADEENIYLKNKISSETLTVIKSEINRYFIVGSEVIGKTILLKKLYLEFYEKGFVPVYIKGSDIKETSADFLRSLILNEIKIQYCESDFAGIEQLDFNKFFILIDDFHRTDLPLKYKARFINNNFIEGVNHKIYPNVIISGNNLLQFEEIVYKDEHFVNPLTFFKSYEMLPFGVKMRYKLIEKWYSNKRCPIEDSEFIFKVEQAERLINTNLGKNFIPSYPLFILVHLHKIDLERETELKTSAYGYYYEYLITTAISRKDTELLDSYLTYLTHFAFYLYENKKHEISYTNFKDFDNNVFRKKYRISKDLDYILKFLKNAGIIDEVNKLYKFKHNYIYYFFTARYFRETISTDDTKTDIQKLVKELYKEDYANILIFLTHLSKDNFILETVVNSANQIFSNLAPFQINDDCKSIESLINTLPKLVIENKNIKENREKFREAADEVVIQKKSPDYNTEIEDDKIKDETVEEEKENSLEKELMNNLRLSFKTTQVLGQLGKNYYGSLTIPQLHDVIEAAYLLGLRTINSFVTFMEQNSDSVVAFIADRVVEIMKEKNKENNKGIDDEKILEIAKKSAFSLCLIITGNMLKRISFAVGTDKLSDTYNEIYEKYDWNSIKLIDISIKLDCYNSFPIKDIIEANKSLKSKKLSSILLNIFVKFYLEMYPVSVENLQKISSELGFEMDKLRLLAHKQKTND